MESGKYFNQIAMVSIDNTRFGSNDMKSIPSHSLGLLRALYGARVVRITRYSWWPKQTLRDMLNIPESQVFSLIAGPLLLTLQDGVEIAMEVDEEIMSLRIWPERTTPGEPRPLREEDDLFPVTNTDPQYSSPYWAGLSGQKIRGVSILKRAPRTLAEEFLPLECGLRLDFDGGQGCIAAHRLRGPFEEFRLIEPDAVPGDAAFEEIKISPQ